MCEIEVGLQLLADRLMPGELPPIVRRNGMNFFPVRLQKLNHRLTDGLRSLAFNFVNQREPGLALNDADNGMFVIPANNGISLPIANPAPLIDNGWARSSIERRFGMMPRRSVLP